MLCWILYAWCLINIKNDDVSSAFYKYTIANTYVDGIVFYMKKIKLQIRKCRVCGAVFYLWEGTFFWERSINNDLEFVAFDRLFIMIIRTSVAEPFEEMRNTCLQKKKHVFRGIKWYYFFLPGEKGLKFDPSC